MRTRAITARLSALAAAAIVAVASASAQGYYDDDIYYDATKAAPKTRKAKKQQQPQTQYYYDGASYVPWTNAGDFQSADSYTVSGTSTRDVDEYNRRTPGRQATAKADAAPDSITLQQFEEMSNTRRLARFHDSQVAQDAYTDDYTDDPNYAVGTDL